MLEEWIRRTLVGAQEHLAFEAFLKEMEDVEYGMEALVNAWVWFKAGWERARIYDGY